MEKIWIGEEESRLINLHVLNYKYYELNHANPGTILMLFISVIIPSNGLLVFYV